VAAGDLIQKHGQAERARVVFANAAEEEILRNAAVENGVNKKNVAALEFGVVLCGGGGGAIGEIDFAAGTASQLNVVDVFPDKMEDDGNVNGANEVGGKDKRALHGDDNIELAATGITRNLAAQSLHAIGDPGGRVCGHFSHSYDDGTSAITTPARVEVPTANSTATGKPRIHAIFPPEVSTGQETFSQRLTPTSFKRRDNLWRF
jgi:hypothetical protein